MSRVAILPGHEYDIVSPAEMDQAFVRNQERMDAYIRDSVRGVKPIRFTSGNTPIGAGASFFIPINRSPQQGYVWAIMRLIFWGTSTLATTVAVYRTSDITNIFANDPASTRVDAFNSGQGIGYALTYGKGQLLLNAGEFLSAGVLSGGVAGTYVFSGEAIEVPAEMVGKLLV